MIRSGNIPKKEEIILYFRIHENIYLNTERNKISKSKEEELDQARVQVQKLTIEDLFGKKKPKLERKIKKLITKFLIILAIVFSALVLVTIILFCIKKKK